MERKVLKNGVDVKCADEGEDLLLSISCSIDPIYYCASFMTADSLFTVFGVVIDLRLQVI